MIIENFTTSDNDQYACNLPKANSFETFSFNVAATSKAKILQFALPDTVLEGRDAVLKCEFTGLPWPNFRVFKATTTINRELIVASEKYQFDGNLLIIRNVTAADIGEYTCSVENLASSDNATIQLNVDSKLKILFKSQPLSFQQNLEFEGLGNCMQIWTTQKTSPVRRVERMSNCSGISINSI